MKINENPKNPMLRRRGSKPGGCDDKKRKEILLRTVVIYDTHTHKKKHMYRKHYGV